MPKRVTKEEHMVTHEITSDGAEFRVRIWDTPAVGWRTLYEDRTQEIFDTPAVGCRNLYEDRTGEIRRYQDQKQALQGVRIYDQADKSILIKAELEVYLEAARSGKPLGECGIPAYVRFDNA